MLIKTNKWFLVCCMLVMSTLIAACSSKKDTGGENSSNKDDFTIRYSIVGTEQHPTALALLELQDELKEMSDGRLKIDFYPNGQLYPDERETNEAVQLGNIEMTAATTASMSTFHEKFMVFDLPYLFDSREEAFEALDGEFGHKVLEGLEDKNFVSLGFQENGFRHLINNKRPIETVSDVKGLKMRVLPSAVYQDTLNLMGADASPLAFGELYSALQQGTYDGMESTVDLLYENKFYEVQDYLTLSSTFFAPVVIVMNKEFYDTLPEDLQKVLTEWSKKCNERAREIMADKQEEYLSNLKKEMEITELTAEQHNTFKDAVKPIYEKYEKEIGKDLIDAALSTN